MATLLARLSQLHGSYWWHPHTHPLPAPRHSWVHQLQGLLIHHTAGWHQPLWSLHQHLCWLGGQCSQFQGLPQLHTASDGEKQMLSPWAPPASRSTLSSLAHKALHRVTVHRKEHFNHWLNMCHTTIEFVFSCLKGALKGSEHAPHHGQGVLVMVHHHHLHPAEHLRLPMRPVWRRQSMLTK